MPAGCPPPRDGRARRSRVRRAPGARAASARRRGRRRPGAGAARRRRGRGQRGDDPRRGEGRGAPWPPPPAAARRLGLRPSTAAAARARRRSRRRRARGSPGKGIGSTSARPRRSSRRCPCTARAAARGPRGRRGPRRALAEPAVGRHAAADREPRARLGGQGPLHAWHERLDDRVLVGRGEVGGARRRLLLPEVAHRVQQRGLEAGEGEVEPATRAAVGKANAQGRPRAPAARAPAGPG